MSRSPSVVRRIASRVSKEWNHFWFALASPSPICVFRIFVGVLALINTLLYVPDFFVWFGSDGAAPLDVIEATAPRYPFLPLYKWWMPDDAVFATLLFFRVMSAFFFMVGFHTRLNLFVYWLLALAFFQRNPIVWHQVDIVLRVWTLLLLFAPCGEMYSVDSFLRSRNAEEGSAPRMFAPWVQRLIQVQLTLIYMEAFWGKVAGPLWRNGTAVYYATHFADGMRRPMPHMFDHLWIYMALTYFTLFIEFSLFFFIWFKPLRYPVLLGGLFFHAGLHYFLHLDMLEYVVVIAYVCYLEPDDLERWIEKGCRFLRLK